jgi:hypothetical protein
MERKHKHHEERSESLSLVDKDAGVDKTILRTDVPSREFMKRFTL